MRNLVEKTLSVRRAFQGRALTIDIASIELPDGRKTTREIIRHRGAAVILGQRPDGKFMLVRQYRKAVEETLLEVVAGGLEPGEAPEAGARREMEEESGYRVTSIEKLGEAVACPGYSEERQYHYFAKLEAQPRGQHPDSDENLEPVALTADEIDARIASGELHDSKSIVAWHFFRTRK